MQTKEKSGSLIKSLGHALSGLVSVIRTERNFRIHICMMLYVIAFSLIGRVGFQTFLKFLICFGVVLAAELMNTAVELVCNEITTEYSKTIKKIKDISAAAVLLAALFSAILGLCVFLSKEVLFAIGETFVSYPIVPIAVFVSLPLFIWFIIGRKNDER
ncbi:MAG: diacylglycerol kinase family protein [Oscillospiraceae bacterium]|nr:diacylglycerol kinase family protein [Oscillospiraceae bacterium]